MSVFVKGNSVYGFDIFIIHLRIRVVQSHYITIVIMSVFVKGNSVYGFDIFIINLGIRVV